VNFNSVFTGLEANLSRFFCVSLNSLTDNVGSSKTWITLGEESPLLKFIPPPFMKFIRG